MADDIFAQLPGPSWRGIPFPLTSMDNEIVQEHVEHYWTYRDGCHIEAVGRKCLIFNASIPFLNSLRPSPVEGWAGQKLYPDLATQFIRACLDKSTGVLNHHELGPIGCKARSVNWTTSAQGPRDGIIVHVRWYESIDATGIADVIAQQSPIANAVSSADVLDSEIAAAGPLPELANDKKSFGQMTREYQNGSGNLGPIQSKVDNTSSALDRLNSVQFWQLRSATEDMRSSLIDLGNNSGRTNQPVRSHTTLFGTSLSTLALQLSVKLPDLITLNPNLVRSPSVPQGSRVKYYSATL